MPTSPRLLRLILAALVLLPVPAAALPPRLAPAAVSRPADAAEPPGDATAAAVAARTGRPVELTSARSESAQVFVQPDGTRRLIQYAEPVRLRRGRSWVPFDTTLRFGPDGLVRPGAIRHELTLSGGGARTPLVVLGRKGAAVRMTWPEALPKPVLRGATATYPEVRSGVDLVITVTKEGFSQVFVVKTARAARNPALRALRFGLTGDGLRIAAKPDGTTVATAPNGRIVFTSGRPVMWESPAARTGTPPRHALLAARFAGTQLTVRPDLRLLAAKTTRFPVFIDPSWTGAAGGMWTHVNKAAPGTSYWTHDRETGAKVGLAYNAAPHMYRSFFQLPTDRIAGAKVIAARFTITLDHTPTRTPTPVVLWHTRPISRAGEVTWTNTADHWLTRLDERDGAAWSGGQPDLAMGFTSQALLDLVRGVAQQRQPTLTVGLRARDESVMSQWKKFRGETASIVVDYNNPPRVPLKVNFQRPERCGTAAAPTFVRTTQPVFSAVGSDPDGDSIVNRLELHRASDDGIQYQLDTGLVSSGAAFSWSPVPAGNLAENTDYYYLARSDDQVAADDVEFGPASPRCYFRIDTTFPQQPVISSTDFPRGTPVTQIRTVGLVTLRPAAGDTDIVEYSYGFTPDKVSQRIKAGPDGSARLPITVNPDPLPSKRLYVRAVDRAGNESTTAPYWNLVARSDAPPPVADVRGDVNGDGLADVTAVVDHGGGRTGIWTVPAGAAGFHTGTMAWDSGVNSSFPLSRTLPVQGDFDGDGRSELVMLHDEAGRRIALYRLKSDGNRYEAPTFPLWRSEGPAWSIGTAHVVAGDVDGDQKTDLVAHLDGGNGNWRVLVFRGADLANPVEWLTTPAGSGDWGRADPVVADLDGDGKDDLVVLKDLGGCRTVADVHISTGTSFGSARTVFTGAAGAFCADRAHLMAGDVDGDRKDDVVALYDNGSTDTDTSLRVLRSTGTALAEAEWWRDPGRFNAVTTTLTVGDHDRDGRDDVALITVLPDGGREVHRLASTGSSFAAPASVWREPLVNATTGPKVEIEPRTYELVARHSGRCLEVEGGSQTDPALLQQWDCSNGLHQRFRIVPLAGTDQYQVQMVHQGVAPADGKARCLDVGNQSTQDNTPVVQWRCVGTANQQVLLDYVEGSSYDTVVRLRFAHSDKCATIGDTTGGNGADLVQLPCDASLSNQQWILRAALNPTQLTGAFAVRSTLSTGYYLDMIDCTPSKGLRMFVLVAGSTCQHWQFRSLGDDVYQIVDEGTNTALQVQGCSTADAAPVLPVVTDTSDCQRWRVEPAVDGTWTIQQAVTGKTLDVSGCKSEIDTPLIVWPYWNGPCQRWRLER